MKNIDANLIIIMLPLARRNPFKFKFKKKKEKNTNKMDKEDENSLKEKKKPCKQASGYFKKMINSNVKTFGNFILYILVRRAGGCGDRVSALITIEKTG